jgi:hypothetical protein
MRIALTLAVFLLASSPLAIAQIRSPLDLSGGYSLVRHQAIEENVHGWVASATVPVYRWLSVTGEGSGGYKNLPILGTDLNLKVHSLMGGPRVSLRRSARLSPFAHLLLGSVRASGSLFDETDSTTEFALQPGGGVDLWLSGRAGVRIGGDYRRVLADEASNEFRLTLGIVIAPTEPR